MITNQKTRTYLIDVDALQQETQKVILVSNLSLLAIRIETKIYVVDNVCTHLGKPLFGGRIIGKELMCPFHAGKFCLKTGRPLGGPVTEPINSYEVEIADNKIFVYLPD